MKSSLEISDFQIRIAYDLTEMLHDAVWVKFKPVLGENEFWIECNLTNKNKLFIYQDGAEISGEDVDIRLEIHDFANEGDMRRDLLNHVAIFIKGITSK